MIMLNQTVYDVMTDEEHNEYNKLRNDYWDLHEKITENVIVDSDCLVERDTAIAALGSFEQKMRDKYY
jgi:hypothetical protein